MSWDQGVQPREDLPPRFVEWADGKMPGGRLEYITWFGRGDEVFLDYGDSGSLKLILAKSDV
jgi:hypothetical protein